VLHKEIPFLRIVLPLSIGIISGLYIIPGKYSGVVASLIITAIFTASLFFNHRFTNIIYGTAITLSFFILGLFLYTNSKKKISNLKPEAALYHCTLADYPEKRSSTLRITAGLNSLITDTCLLPLNGSVILYLRTNKDDGVFLPGDEIVVKLTPAEIENRGNPYEFDYKFYMENRGIRYFSFIEDSDIQLHNQVRKRKLVHSSLILRERIIDMYLERGVSEEKLGLAAAITLGQKKMLDPDQKLSFINAGIMHIMAVSGLHAMILSIFILKMLFFLKGRLNPVRVIVAIIIIWIFAFITGLSPSVVRAALMFSFLQAGNLMKRRVNSVNSVLASAYVLILIRPAVIFDAGFLLSYSAVIFIIVFYHDFYNLLQFNNRITDWIWKTAVVTIVAQAGTLPFTITLFNRFPTYFILTNVIIVPLSSLVIIAGCLIPITYYVPAISGFFAFSLDFLTGLTESLTFKAASLPCSTIDNIGMTNPECFLLTAVISLSFYFFLKKDKIPLQYPLLALLMLALAGTIKAISVRTTNEVIVYNTFHHPSVCIRTGGILNVYSAGDTIQPEILRHCATLGLAVSAETPSSVNKHLIVGNSKISIINPGKTNSITTISSKNMTDQQTDKPAAENASTETLPAIQIIVANPGSVNDLMHRLTCAPSGKIHIIKKSGAYRMRL
jgi:competence protein ComEC